VVSLLVAIFPFDPPEFERNRIEIGCFFHQTPSEIA